MVVLHVPSPPISPRSTRKDSPLQGEEGDGTPHHPHQSSHQIPWVVVLQDKPARAQGATQSQGTKIPCLGQDLLQHPWQGSELLTVPRLAEHRLDWAASSGSCLLPAATETLCWSCPCSRRSKGSSGSWSRIQVSEDQVAAGKDSGAEQGSMCPSSCIGLSPALGVTSGLKVTPLCEASVLSLFQD